jgi:hypothetical protein
LRYQVFLFTGAVVKILARNVLDLIYIFRGKRVMLDRDIALLYGVPTMRLNEQVKRNSDRFPEDFMFQLNIEEFKELSEIGKYGGSRKLPYVFTEQGIAMLSSVLRSQKAIEVNIQIMRAFVEMRDLISGHQKLEQKIQELEKKYDQQFKVVFDTLREALVPNLDDSRRKIGLNKK